jgi:hypothetical protein
MARYRNWPEILKLDDPFLQQCLILTDSEETLTIIERGAPYLFSRRPVRPYRVSLSTLRRRDAIEARKARVQATQDVILAETCEHLGIPVLMFLPEDACEGKKHEILLDEATYNSLPKPIVFGKTVTIGGRKLVVLQAWDTEEVTSFDKTEGFMAVPAECVDISR